jgi:hypothetical protein
MRRLAPLVVVLALAGCAGMNSVTSDVATFGEWPAGRPPGTFTIERLPSQQVRGAQQDTLEAAARSALEQAGFKPAADAGSADVVVQIGARVTRTDFTPWDDPLWWRWGGNYWRRPGYYWRPGWGFPPQYESQYDQEVGLLIRDRRTGSPLYEARASNESRSQASTAALGAMFQAALKDFPNAVPQAHRVQVELAPKAQ